MDVVSHGLWSVVAAKTLKSPAAPRHDAWRWAFWGVFPDIFAFGPAFIWLGYSLVAGNLDFSDLPFAHKNGEPPDMVRYPIFRLAPELYDLSHSLFVYGAILALAYIIYRRNNASLLRTWRPLWAWGLHILTDIPTHSYRFYPTPLFFPFSAWKFNGIAWSEPWFMTLDFSLLFAAFALLWWRGRAAHKTAI